MAEYERDAGCVPVLHPEVMHILSINTSFKPIFVVSGFIAYIYFVLI